MSEQVKIKYEEVNTADGTVTESEAVVQATSSVKPIVDNALISMLSLITKPWYKALPALTLCNKFVVLVLIVFFVSGYLPAIKLLGNSQTLYQLLDMSLFHLAILTVIAFYAIGVKRLLSKLAMITLILFALYQLNEMREIAAQFLGSNSVKFNDNAINMALKSVRYGLFLWLGSFLVLMLLAISPMYQSNKNLWLALVGIVNTKPNRTLDVKVFTNKITTNVQLAVQKGHDSIEQINTDSTKVKLRQLRSLSAKKKSAIVISAVMVFLVLPMLLGGSSLPSTDDVEKIITKAMLDESGFLNTELSEVNLKNCEEISGRDLPTFNCTVEGVVTADFGEFGAMLGGNTKKSEAFSVEYIFVKGDNGWYGQ